MKVAKSTVDYSPGHQSSHCGDDGKLGRTGMCSHYQHPHGCEVVAGDINPDYWCRRFLKARSIGSLARHVRA